MFVCDSGHQNHGIRFVSFRVGNRHGREGKEGRVFEVGGAMLVDGWRYP